MIKLGLLIAIFCVLGIQIRSASAQGLPVANPGDVGMSASRLERLDKVLGGYVQRRELAGVIGLVAREGKIAHFFRAGVRDFKSGEPLRDDSMFRIFSMTKPIASAAVMMLYEEGAFQLDDPVEKYIPEFSEIRILENGRLVEPERRITILDLLRHTSALNYDYPEDSEYHKQYREMSSGMRMGTLKDMVARLVKLPLNHQPGTKWAYSSMSTDVLGYLVEVLSGVSFETFLRERIFTPLGMVDTGFYVPADKVERFTAMYGPPVGGNGELKLLDDPATSRFTSGPATYFSGAGGLVSTAADYVRFAQMMLNGGELDGVRLLGRKTVELMTSNHLPPEMIPYRFIDPRLEYVTRGFGFGLGYAVLMDVPLSGAPGSAGLFKWAGAANTDEWIDPREQLIGILLTQFMPNGHYPLDRQFRTLVYQALVD